MPEHCHQANITLDLLEPLEEELRNKVRDKKERHRMQCERALAAFDGRRARREPETAVAGTLGQSGDHRQAG
jgi:methylenetetrahydrofolate--tRNA-(uracil-5-)-methyltransferase